MAVLTEIAVLKVVAVLMTMAVLAVMAVLTFLSEFNDSTGLTAIAVHTKTAVLLVLCWY